LSRQLPGRVVVLSPHLDDAALSVGATIAASAAAGADVHVITVFANDPAAAGPASAWDAACGFGTAGEAAAARRIEDADACAILGADAHWLPFADRDHVAPADGDRVWAAVAELAAGADVVLAPGWPLHHADHAWLARAVATRPALAPRRALYVEQPYSVDAPLLALARKRPGPLSPVPALAEGLEGLGLRPRWRTFRPRAAELRAKHRAIAAYRSQLHELGPLVRARIGTYELALGCEGLWWIG
jgi:LmbE family N-acetylglucosaminyl deacetylase